MPAEAEEKHLAIADGIITSAFGFTGSRLDEIRRYYALEPNRWFIAAFRDKPAGVVGASLLFGMLRAGAARMQSVAGVPTEIVQIVQALVIVFIAAPAIIRALYRLRQLRREEEPEAAVFSRGWGS